MEAFLMATGGPDVLAPRQRQTQNARAALARKFDNPESKSTYYRDLGRKAAESRIVLNASEAEALRGAYALLTRIAERGKLAPPVSHFSEEPAAA
jgi:hypothetical protein